ncbi:hypothetical protein [Pseudomonas cyclaminis]|uniref:hypothetical protein n=1 Tax=Pseudomonas cyclaminis TaxID=2781239 RepID=UPI00103F0521
MNIYTDWLHGTPSLITQWTLTGRGALKGTTPLHKGLFFTTSRKFALASGRGHGASSNLYQATVKPGAHVLDITDPDVTCTPHESEHLRQLVVSRRPGLGNIQCEYEYYWKTGWRTGDIMKYAPRPGDEMMAKTADLALHQRHTSAGLRAWNLCQMITRQCIEDIVDASIEAGYQAVAGNERQDGVTYPILIVLDPDILTIPVKI